MREEGGSVNWAELCQHRTILYFRSHTICKSAKLKVFSQDRHMIVSILGPEKGLRIYTSEWHRHARALRSYERKGQ